MSAEAAHALYTVLAFALGWTCHLAWTAFVNYHDARKNHEIHRLQWENDQLKRQLAEAPAPLEEPPPPTTGSNIIPPAPKEVIVRKRRSPVKAEIKPVQPRQMDTSKVPPVIPQADLGRMQAQLAAYGRCRTVFAGGKQL